MFRLKSARTIADGRGPLVSVIVPCYNYGRFLSECTRSVLSQDAVETKILLIDDASPDGSGEIAEALAAQESRITVIRHKRNIGHIATYNEGLDCVDGDYAVLLSADDLLTPGSLARAVALLEANPSVGMAYGHPIGFRGPEIPSARQTVHSWSVWKGPNWIRAQARRGLSCIFSPEAVVRTSVQKRVGGYRKTLPHTCDLEMWLRIAAVADIGRVNGPDQAYRRIHSASMMQTKYSTVLEDLKGRKAAYESFFTRDGAVIRGGLRSSAVARRRLAEEALEYACYLLETGDDRAGLAAEYAAFAEESLPQARQLWTWQEYRLRLEHDSGRMTSLRRRGFAMRRDVEGRLRFRRWQWIGV